MKQSNKSLNRRRVRQLLMTAVLALGMVLSMFPAMAEEGEPESYGLWIGGQEVTADNLSGTGWNFNTETNTLTLDNYTNVSGERYASDYDADADLSTFVETVLRYEGTEDLNLVLEGKSTLMLPVRTKGVPGYSAPLFIGGEAGEGPGLTISGTGELFITAGNASKRSYGIYCYKDFAVNGGKVIAVGGEAEKNSYGLYSYNGHHRTADGQVVPGVLVNGGTLRVDGGKAGAGSYGLYTEWSDISVTGGTLQAVGGEAGKTSYGIYSGIYGVETKGGTLIGTGGTVTDENGESFGIYNGVSPMYFNEDSNVTFTGGTAEKGTSYGLRGLYISFSGATLTATGGSGINSYGILNSSSATMKAGSVTAAGGSASQRSCGIYTGEDVTLTGGTLNVTGGSVNGKDAISSGIYFDYRTMDDGSLEGGSLAMTGGTLNATGGTAAGEDSNSFGIFIERGYDDGKITVGGGTVTAVGGDVSGVGDLWSGGIDTQNLIVSGGSVTGTGGNITGDDGTRPKLHFFETHGIYAWNDMTLSGGTVSGTGGTVTGGSELPMSTGFYAMTMKMNGGALTGTGYDAGVNCMVLQADKGVITGKGTDTSGSNTGIFIGTAKLGADVVLIGEAAGTSGDGISIFSGKDEEEEEVSSVFNEALKAFMGADKAGAEPKSIDEFLKLKDEEGGVPQYVRIAAKPYSVTFDANGGVFRDGRTSCDVNGEAGDKISSIAPASRPTQEARVFDGWALDNAGSQPVDETTVQGDGTVYAVWKKADFTVTLDANGGTFDNGKATKQVGAASGAKASELTADAPRPADWEDPLMTYTFKFWSLTKDGEQVDDNQMITKGTTLYAIWDEHSELFPDDPDDQDQGGGGTAKYVPNIADSDNGKVSVDPKAPAKGDTVTVTASPDEGYTLGSLTVKDSRGNDVPVSKNADGTYSFIQPNGKVTITPVFEAIQTRPFVDVKDGDWFYDAVYHCFDNGYFKGTDETHFTPGGTMTRAMFATVLYRLDGQPEVTGESKFSDVPAGQWYTDGVT